VRRSRLCRSSKGQRAAVDCAAPMGRGPTVTLERPTARAGLLNDASPHFVVALDIAEGKIKDLGCKAPPKVRPTCHTVRETTPGLTTLRIFLAQLLSRSQPQ